MGFDLKSLLLVQEIPVDLYLEFPFYAGLITEEQDTGRKAKPSLGFLRYNLWFFECKPKIYLKIKG